MDRLTKNSKAYLSGEYEELFRAAATGNLTEAEAEAYSRSYYKELEHESAVRFAEKRSRAGGRAEGILDGLISCARRMIKSGMSDETIREMTALSPAEIAAIRTDM